jgi:hypothetical protein
MRLALASCLLLLAVAGCKSKATDRPGGEKPVEAPPATPATPPTRDVIGDGFLYQVPDAFKQTALPDGTPAYTGTIEGADTPAKLTFWATTEPFTGDLAALAARETQRAISDGGSPDAGPVMVTVAGQDKQDYAQRITIKFADRIELRTIAVHGGVAYIHHCETPNVRNAWANVGTECIARGTSFHIAPPPP